MAGAFSAMAEVPAPRASGVAAESVGAKPPELAGKPPDLSPKPPELAAKPPELLTFLEWAAIPADLQAELHATAAPVAEKRKASTEVVRATVLPLCAGRFLGSRVLAQVLRRDSDDLRKRTLTPMVREGALLAAHLSPRDPRQANTAGAKAGEFLSKHLPWSLKCGIAATHCTMTAPATEIPGPERPHDLPYAPKSMGYVSVWD